MKLIVGLGNKDNSYKGTRHNVGYDLIDELIEEYDTLNLKEKFKSLYQIVTIDGEKIIFQKPQTYMNLSGEAIYEILNFYKLDPKTDLIVIYDDMDISLGNYKLKKTGRDAGHNGIKSILSRVPNEFLRIKIGIDRKKGDFISHVLGKFTESEKEQIQKVYKEIKNIVKDSMKMDNEKLLNKYNKKNMK